MQHEQPDDLFDLGLRFNLFPAQYVHASRLMRLGVVVEDDDPATDVSRSPAWTRALSAAVLRDEQLDQHFDCDFHDPARRLALLDAVTLTQLGGLVSAVLLRPRLRRIVQQSQVRVVHACMGSEAHQFALRWSGIVPAIPTLFGHSEDWTNGDSWAQMSVAQTIAVIPTTAVGVIGRLRLRFPAQWALPDPRQPPLDEAQRASLMTLIVSVVEQCAPQWGWLFTGSASVAAGQTALEGARC